MANSTSYSIVDLKRYCLRKISDTLVVTSEVSKIVKEPELIDKLSTRSYCEDLLSEEKFTTKQISEIMFDFATMFRKNGDMLKVEVECFICAT